MINSLGLLEVRGFVTALEAADAMLKSASVRLIRQYETSPGWISLVVEGDIASCRAAVDAGVAAAARLGEVVSRQEIGRPDPDVERMVLKILAPQPKKTRVSRPARVETPAEVVDIKPPAALAEADQPVVLASAHDEKNEAAGCNEEAILAAVAAAENGLTLAELLAALPEAGVTRRALENLCKAKRLAKLMGRYCKLT
ncbi:BMC domain-containing protein [Iodobacter fluviatilis]|uniref:Ethanolamine utilization protein EutK n=1 Tax=Iodobacter fluviatilis TaxID=537 RepID=A0A377SVG5_9NEIS|nr:BMC domain-containing protein [Iodobacter fluviatilis]TCU87864.1 ethanolamine utilization protein EutK [Iodobacter fluviatilis]STR45365.1 Ethanolamine utilization protein EutK precursor [Iodobacter fluviatilis]